MIDLVFDLDGGTLPAAYPFALWAALLRLVPQLAEERLVGVLPLRATENKEGILLTKRTKLVLRLPKTLADPIAARLTGSTLQIGVISLHIGKCKPRVIQPYPTIHAQQVTGASDEALFMDDIRKQLGEMGIAAKLICGKRSTLKGEQQSTHAYSLVAHDLKPEDSLQLQYAGLGEDRQLGCGIFIPYKVISGLSED
ncbi:MAG: type I-MYXAN CRISPR-associated protein Cas6/Cmx6 [Gallionellales bacterium RBG_16_57_15]|nr:MAG: type I-MYXAN CRISPR-associated protein Cas6/Cmx6 [Gallionellales bacterium RBG_16_57_15]